MSLRTMRHVALPAGELIPVLGQGTWHMAEIREQRTAARDVMEVGNGIQHVRLPSAGGAR
jgi:diketogulonate reductase-like aldo/keto reductase